MSFPPRTRRPPGETFDQIPAWFIRYLIKTGEFKKFDELAFKLLVYFAKTKNSKDITPWTTIDDLTGLVGACWRRTKTALTRLLEIGVIRQETQRRSIRFRLVFKDPYAHAQEQATDTAGQTPLRSRKADSGITRTATATATKADVHVDASVEGRSPSCEYVKTADNPARFSTQSYPKRQASKEPSWPPTWDDIDAPHSSADASVYTAGEDVDSIAQGRPQ